MAKEPDKSSVRILPVEGHPYVKGRSRQIVFLENDEDKFVNASPEFAKAPDKAKKGINTAIQKWEHGMRAPKRHHGWDQSEHAGAYVKCYVFKHANLRYYGVLLHPRIDAREQLCILVHTTKKNESEVNTTILDKLNRARTSPEVLTATEKYWSILQGEEESNHGNEKKKNQKKR